MKNFLFLLLTPLILFFATITFAQESPYWPESYIGNATLEEELVSAGTSITVKVTGSIFSLIIIFSSLNFNSKISIFIDF